MSFTATLRPVGPAQKETLPASSSVVENKLIGSTHLSEFDERRHKRNRIERASGHPAPLFSIEVILTSSRVIMRFGNGGSVSHIPDLPSSTESTRARASCGRAGASSGKQRMLSMGVPSSVRRCKKWGRIYPASPSHRLPAADVFVIFFVVGIGGGGGKKRWKTEGVDG